MVDFSSLLRRTLLLAGLPLSAALAQTAPGVGIGTTTPAASAVLDVTATSQGVLLPRLTTAQRDAIASPATGLLIFNLDTQVLNSYDGTRWVPYVGVTPVPATLSYTRTAFSPVSSGTYTYTVPAGITALEVELAGGSGAGGSGGLGGRVQATLAVTPGQVLTIILGGSTQNNPATSSPNGGAGANMDYGGGGATDIRIGGTALSNRVLVAGGGGGMGSSGAGGAGGGLVARAGAGTGPGGGGTQTQGGIGGGGSRSGGLGFGGVPVNGNGRGGGGGGGYYGGGGGDGTGGGGGGGGSSYADPALATGVVHTVGYNSGQGYARLTPVSGPAPVLNGSNFYNVPGDNLGNHSATQTIGLNGNLLAASTTSSVGLGLSTAGDVLASRDVLAGRAVVVDQLNASDGTFSAGSIGLHFGNNSGEGITSARTNGSTNLNGLDFYTTTTRRLSITGAGRIGIGTATPTKTLHIATETLADGILISSTSQAIGLRLDNGQGTADLGLAYFNGQYTPNAVPGDVVLRANDDHNLLLAATGAGTVRVTDLVGTGTRMVTADANGSLGSQALPSGTDFVQNQTATVQTAGFNVSGSGTVGGAVQAGTNVVVDAAGTNDGVVTGNILRLGSGSSGEGIGSKRTSGGNQYGLDFYTGSTNRLSLTLGGQIGIGTTTPYSQLSNTSQNIIGSDGQGGNPGSLAWSATQRGYVGMFYNGATGLAANGLSVKVAGVGSNISVLDVSAGGTQLGGGNSLLNVRASGNVGIGISDPTQKLEVAGTIFSSTGGFRFPDNTVQTTAAVAATGTNFIQNSPTQQASASFNVDGSGTVGGALQAGTDVLVDATGTNAGTPASLLRFGGTNSGEGIASQRTSGGNQYGLDFYTARANRLSITVGGNIGIGTAAPAGGLHITTGNSGPGTGSATAGAILSGQAGSPPYLELRGSGTGTSTTTPYLDFAETSDVDYTARLISQGGVLNVNNAAGGTVLKVNGNATVTGTLTASAVTQTSDVRFKTDVRPLGGALASVLALRGVRYHWNALGVQHGGQAGAEQVGLLAQELEKVYPELVSTGPDGYKAVNYAQLAPVLIEALKEQQAQIEALKQQAAAANARAATAETQAARATATTEAFESRLRRLEAGSAQAQR